MENSELENLGADSDQSTSEFDQNVSEKISEVFISEFSVLGTVQNGNLGVEKPGKNILRGFRDFRELRVFDLIESFSNPPRYSPIFLKYPQPLKFLGTFCIKSSYR